MSKVVNDEGYKPGSIYRIALENFVTYKQVVLYPGPSLNMIIGPNGTGKSTFVCAIILGLCGKTSVIGRAKKISEYVRSGCEQSTIEIELYQQQGERNVIITRHFNLRDVSTWHINNKSVREAQVQELITSLNIQVDNLCQLLPQDRVQDFSKMNPQQLLRSTLSAVGGQDSVTQMDELIACRVQQKELSSKVQNNAQIIQEQERLNERLKVVIDAMKQRQEIEKQIEICEKKKLWLEYHELYGKVKEYQIDRKKAKDLVDSHKSKMEPLENVIENAKVGIRKLEQKKLSATRDLHTLRDKVKELINAVRDHEYTLKDIEASFQEKLEQHRNREQDLVEARAKLEKLVTDKNTLLEKVGDESQVKAEIAKVEQSINKTRASMDGFKKTKREIEYDLEKNIMPQIRLYQNRIRNLEDVDVKRLEVLRNYSEDCYQAVKWLRSNKEVFQHPVYEPMMLEINFTDPKFARYLESTVAARDLVAFTFESSHDMNLFLQKVRQELKLKRVNAICSQGGKLNVQSKNIQPLSYLGFYTYLVDTITAPDAITRYLCKQYNIHNIPIGNNHTYENSNRVPANVTYYFTENHRFTVRQSAYSGAISSSTIEIRDARLLANTVDLEQLENFNKQLSSFELKARTHKGEMQKLVEKMSTIAEAVADLNNKRIHLNDGIKKVHTISAQIRIQTQKVHDIENEPTFNLQREKEKCRKKQKNCVLQQTKIHEELVGVMKSLQDRELNGQTWKFIVAGAPVLAAFSAGGAASYPTVLLHQLKANDSTIPLDFETSTWIGSVHGLAGLPSILMPTFMQWRGRKFSFIAASLVIIIGWIVAYTATSVASIIISECLHGLGTNCIFAISVLSMTEMMSPRYREVFLQMYMLSQCIAMAINGILTQYAHWKTVAIVMGIPAVISALIALIWPESPYWLAYKGRIRECKTEFEWLRGSDEKATKELDELIVKQTENAILNRKEKKMSIRSFCKVLASRDFFIPAMHMFVLVYFVYWTGGLVLVIYAIELVNKATQNETATFFGSLIINSVLTTGITISMIVNKYFKRKTILLTSALGMTINLLCAATVTYLQNVEVIPKKSILCLLFFAIYVFFSSIGAVSLSFPVSMSLMPVRYRGIGGGLFVIYVSLVHTSSLKFAPYLFRYIYLWGTCLVFALNATVCGFILWKYIPETQDRTLQEIENYYADGGWSKVDEKVVKETELLDTD